MIPPFGPCSECFPGGCWTPLAAFCLGFHSWDLEVQPRPGARPTQEPLRMMLLLYADDPVLLDDIQRTLELIIKLLV